MAAKLTTRNKMMVVEWGDAFIDTDDFKEEDAKNTRPVWRKTIGFFLAKNQHGITLATDEYNDPKDGVAARMFIPAGMVKRTRYVK